MINNGCFERILLKKDFFLGRILQEYCKYLNWLQDFGTKNFIVQNLAEFALVVRSMQDSAKIYFQILDSTSSGVMSKIDENME